MQEANTSSPEPLHAVQVLARQVLVGNATRLAGDIVHVGAARAREMHGSGSGRVLDPSKVRDLPDSPLPRSTASAAMPWPDDPRVMMKVLKGTPLCGGRVFGKGDEASVPERVAVQWLLGGVARLAKGQELSPRGRRYQADLQKNPASDSAY